jgi:hypothetical protein
MRTTVPINFTFKYNVCFTKWLHYTIYRGRMINPFVKARALKFHEKRAILWWEGTGRTMNRRRHKWSDGIHLSNEMPRPRLVWKKMNLINSIIFVLFDKYCPIIDQLGLKDSSRDFQLNCVISYFFTYIYYFIYGFKDWCDGESEKILTSRCILTRRKFICSWWSDGVGP